MDVMIAVLLVAVGGLGGWLVFDAGRRREAVKELTITRDEFRAALARVSEAHNSLATKIQEVQDQVNQHEFRLTGRPAGTTRSVTVGAQPG